MSDATDGSKTKGRRKTQEGKPQKGSKKEKKKTRAAVDNDANEEEKIKSPLPEEEEAPSESPSPKISFEEYAGEAEEDMYPFHRPSAKSSTESLSQFRSGKPQVWIKIRPSPDVQDNLFEVTEDQKGIRFIPDYSEPFDPRSRTRPRFRESQSFYCDGVLGNTTQEESFRIIANDVVERAMEGISGIVVSVGPEVSGKHFTLFGSIDKFQYRGIIPRSLERMFQICTAKAAEMRYLIRMAIVEVRNDKIRDLLNLGPFEGSHSDRDAPNGMIFQKIGTAEHGLGLLIRALTCQKQIPREPYAKPHTVVFVDIYGESHTDGMQDSYPRIIKSRITFAKTAAIPERDVIFPPPTACSSYLDSYGCPVVASERPATAPAARPTTATSSAGCNKFSCTRAKQGPIAEAIRIRQDLGFLEQMCSRACEYQKLTQYYEKLYRLGLEVPIPPRSQHYRLSKLTYCLKEIVSGNSEIRVILHVRAERRYKHATLEAMRFAEKARSVPHGAGLMVPGRQVKSADVNGFSEDFSLIDFLNKMPPEVLNLYVQVQPGTFRAMKDHAAAMIDSRVQPVEDVAEEKVNELFNKFRSLWISLMQNGTMATNSLTGMTQKSDLAEEEGSDQRLVKKRESTTETSSKHVVMPKDEDGEGVPPGKHSRKISRGKSLHSASHQSSKEKIKTKRLSRKSKPSTTDIPEVASKSPSKLNLAGAENQETPPPTDPTEEAAHDEEEETVTPAVSVTKLASEVPTKEEAINEFLTTPNGSVAFQNLQTKTEELKKLAAEHNNTIKETSAVISRLNSLHTELNLIQQERFLQGAEYESTGEIRVGQRERSIIQELKTLEKTREEMSNKMSEARQRVYNGKREVDSAKMELDIAFQNYAKEAYGVAYTESGEWERILKNESGPGGDANENDEERIRKYEVIKRVAKKQARLFLKSLVKKPMWVPY